MYDLSLCYVNLLCDINLTLHRNYHILTHTHTHTYTLCICYVVRYTFFGSRFDVHHTKKKYIQISQHYSRLYIIYILCNLIKST